MRKLTAVLLALMLAAAVGSALADTEITVTGSGEILIPADTAVVSLGVSVRDRDALKAQGKANEVIARIRQTLTENGIAAENINTGYVSLYAVYDYSQDEETISGYSANSSLAVQVADVSLAGQVIDLAFGAGANNLNGVSFSASDDTEAREAALKAAVADAKHKAEILAEAAGIRITGIEAIQTGYVNSYEGGVNTSFRKTLGAAEAEADEATVLQAARISVTADVTVTYKAE